MTKYATVDAAGRPLGFYCEDIHGEAIPKGAIKISDEVYAQWITNTQSLALKGGTLADVGVAPPPASWATVRARRNRLLAQSDKTQLPDSPLASDAKLAWAEYRSLLRKLPQTYTDPSVVVWPAAPSF